MLRNTTLYAYNVRIYYTIDLWTSMTYCYDFWQCKVSVLCALLTTYPQHGPCMILETDSTTRLCLRDNLCPFLCYLGLRRRALGFWGCHAASLLSWPRRANLQKALRQKLEMWMKNGTKTRSKSHSKQRDQQRIIPCYLGHQLFTWSAFA